MDAQTGKGIFLISEWCGRITLSQTLHHIKVMCVSILVRVFTTYCVRFVSKLCYIKNRGVSFTLVIVVVVL